LRAVSYNKKLVAPTTYSLEISFNHAANQFYYQKKLRFTDLEALDEVISEKFKNLKFPELPSKTVFQLSEAETRFRYL
jgi:hypothetical protein